MTAAATARRRRSVLVASKSRAARTYRGREEFLDLVIRPFDARMRSRLVPTVRGVYADGSTVVVFFDASGVARDGRRYANAYAWLLEMSDGRIVNAHVFFDSIAFDELWERVAPEAGA